jgi:hypothetical protein
MYNNTKYTMTCPQGTYEATSWLSLGYEIIKHRMWHLFKGHGFID